MLLCFQEKKLIIIMLARGNWCKDIKSIFLQVSEPATFWSTWAGLPISVPSLLGWGRAILWCLFPRLATIRRRRLPVKWNKTSLSFNCRTSRQEPHHHRQHLWPQYHTTGTRRQVSVLARVWQPLPYTFTCLVTISDASIFKISLLINHQVAVYPEYWSKVRSGEENFSVYLHNWDGVLLTWHHQRPCKQQKGGQIEAGDKLVITDRT